MNESWQHGGQVKAPVESPRSFRQVAPRILGLTDCVIAAADGTLDVAEHDIGPTRALGLGGRTTASGLQHGVRMTTRFIAMVELLVGTGPQPALTPSQILRQLAEVRR